MKNRLSIQIQHRSPRRFNSQKSDDGVNPLLLDLVRLRVAQIHQCPISMAKHMDELVASGETQERLDQLKTWTTSSFFDENERAALALCEKISHDPQGPLPEYLIREVRQYFTKGAIVNLVMAIIAVNDWTLL